MPARVTDRQSTPAGISSRERIEFVHIEGAALEIHLPDADRAGVGQHAIAALASLGLGKGFLELILGDGQFLGHLDIGRALFLGTLLGVPEIDQVAHHLVVIGAQTILKALTVHRIAHHMPDQGGGQPLQHQAIERAGGDALGVQGRVALGDDADDGGLGGDGRADADQFKPFLALDLDADQGDVEAAGRQGIDGAFKGGADFDFGIVARLTQGQIERGGLVGMGGDDQHP